MAGYLVNFAIYTMAMLGLIFFALMVYKKFAIGGALNRGSSKNRILSIEEAISIAPRKTLYVVRAGEEKFLIAGDIDKTTLISKLGDNSATNKTFTDTVGIYEEKQPVKTTVSDEAKTFVDEIKKVEDKNIELKSDDKSPEIDTLDKHFDTKSVDDLPIIVDFQKREKQKSSVIQDMLEKING